MTSNLPLILGVSGASDTIYAVRCEISPRNTDYAIELVCFKSAAYMI